MAHDADLSPASFRRANFDLRTLGACVLTLDGQVVKLNTRKNLALLAYLAFRPAHTESRHRLAGLLWGEFPEDRARTSLRQAVAQLSELQTSDGARLIMANRNEVQLNPSALNVDVMQAMDELSRGIVPDIFLTAHHFEDAFLSAIENIDSSFAGWLQQKRTSLRNEFIRKLTDILNKSDSPDEMRRVSSAILNLDSVNEPACRAFMQASCMVGDFTSALRIYNELWSKLQAEFDTEPDQATQNLIAAIKKGEANLGVAGAVETPFAAANFNRTRHRLDPLLSPTVKPILPEAAVQLTLMVENCSHFGADAGLAPKLSLLRSETLMALTRFRETRIIDRNALSGPCEWDYALRCDAFLEARTVNIVLNIYRATPGFLVWSERLVVPEAFLAENAACTANRIAAMVQRITKTAHLAEIDDRALASLDLASRMLRAQHALNQWDMQEEYLARKLLLSIFDQAHRIASAHSGYSSSLSTNQLVFPGKFRTVDNIERILKHATTAINLDSLDRRSHLAYAWALMAKNDFHRACNAFQHTVNLNIADNWSYISAAEGLALCGDNKASKVMLDAFLARKVPLQESHWAYLTVIYLLQGDFVASADASRNCPLLLNIAGAWGAAAMALAGDVDEARVKAERFKADARNAWCSELDPSDEVMSRWVLQGFPIGLPQQRLISEGLQRAGFKFG